MPRSPDSPPSRKRHDESRYDDRKRPDYAHERRRERDSNDGYDRRVYSRRDGPRGRENESRREEDLYGYRESDRERERRRDRDRYDRDARSSRRSASPGRSQRRSNSRSTSPPAKARAKPNFGASGLLAAETNTVKSVDGKNSTVLKYNEPPEARKPTVGWRLYVFKDGEQVELLHISRQSAYLVGRDRLVADIPIEHPSCSKQHAVIQYRHVKEKTDYGEVRASIKPFIIDLESTNGTIVNDETIPTSRYYELKNSDVIKFGQSAREYVLLHDSGA